MYKRKGIALKKKRKSLMYKHKIPKFFFYEAKEFSCFKKSLKITFLAWVISIQSQLLYLISKVYKEKTQKKLKLKLR